ncbi:MAG: anti-sigma factor antagonist [Calditrichaeota bacterium]|nr:MAG: anti-sigma factor antagonist [Calditrichota bacterium]
MKIKERILGNVAILELSGKLLGGPPDSQEFKDKIYALIDQGIVNVVVDLKDVKRMNSSGLGILISALTSLRNRNGDLKLAAIDELMEGILIMTKLNTIFETYDTAEGAAQSFK